MSDIFISYAREDEARIQPLVAAFEAEGWSVFWDRRIPAGSSWRSYIGAALQEARCVVVVWSAHSVESQWVAEEADDGKARQALVPVSLDAVLPPRGFREIQAADLKDWVPGQASEPLANLLKDLRRRLGAASPAPPVAPVAASAPVPAPPAQAPVPPTPAPAAAGRGWRKGLVAVAALAVVAVAAYLVLRPAPAPVTQVRPSATPAPDAPTRRPAPASQVAPSAAWLVVAGSFDRSDRRRADRQMTMLAQAGFDARVVDSSDYPLLTPNLWVVALGPFDSREAGEAALGRLKPQMSDAYLKKAR